MPEDIFRNQRMVIIDTLAIFIAVILVGWLIYMIQKSPAPSAVRFVPEPAVLPEPTGAPELRPEEIPEPTGAPELPSEALPTN